MVVHRFGERAEDHAGLGEGRLERGGHRDRVDDGVDGDVAQQLLLVQRDAELVEHLANLWIDVVDAVEYRLLLRRRPVADRLVVDRGDLQLRPVGFVHLRPGLVRRQPPVEQPLGLVLLGRDQPHDVLAQPGRRDVGVEVGAEAVLVTGVGQFLDLSQRLTHRRSSLGPIPWPIVWQMFVPAASHATERDEGSVGVGTAADGVRCCITYPLLPARIAFHKFFLAKVCKQATLGTCPSPMQRRRPRSGACSRR